MASTSSAYEATEPVSKTSSTSTSGGGGGVSAEVEALRRQLIALQRVSSLGVLAGGICHELNNALTPILNYARLGLRNADSKFRERAFAKILEGGQRAAAITGGVLGLARPQEDRREPTDLVRLAEEVILLVGKDLVRNRVHLDFTAQGRPHARVNPAQIQQVLLNLLINARQAMPKGGTVRLRVSEDPVARLAEVSVSDTGVGIATADLRHIFDPFFTTKHGPDGSGLGGTGLGLSVCRDIVAAHHGRLRAESRLGQGTTFTLRLPSCPAPAPREGEVPPEPSPTPGQGPDGPATPRPEPRAAQQGAA
jgi:signal transduction histidine kinase